MRRKIASLGIVLSVGSAALYVASCGGNLGRGQGNANPFDGQQTGVAGRAVYRLTVTLTAAQLAALTDADKAKITANGAKLVGSTIQMPDVPARGHWVRIGTQQTNTDGNGRFRFASLVGSATSGAVYRQLSDPQPVMQFPVSAFVRPVGNTTPDIEIPMTRAMPGDMNPPSGSRARVVSGSCCSKVVTKDGRATGLCLPRDTSYVNGNDGPCCLDYDNPIGDGQAYCRTKVCLTAYTNWLWSTCEQWSFGPLGTACANEGAYVSGGPSCYENHKWRNCQNLDPNDFSVTVTGADTSQVFAGRQLRFSVRNNTPANETEVTLSQSFGNLTGDGYEGTALKHYVDGNRTITVVLCGNDGESQSEERTVGTHYVERTLTYQAPTADQFPAGQDEVPMTLTIRGFDKTQTVSFRVRKCP